MNEKSAFCQYCKRNGSRDDCIDCSAQFDPAGKRISPPSNYVPNSSDNPVEHPAHYTSGGIERMTHEEAKQILCLSGGANYDD